MNKRMSWSAVVGAVAAGMMLTAAGTAGATTFTSSNGGYWTNAATWGGAEVPTNAADDVYIQSGHTITNTGTSQISINSLSITGTLTHASNADTEADIINLLIGAGGLTIDAAGQINVTSRGYSSGGVGNGRYGGSHAGRGGFGNGTTYVGDTYDSLTNPVKSGARGSGAAGGGVVILNVTGTATINGNIWAKGNNASGTSGAGAGGSINITAGTISGTGTNSVGGGDNSPSPDLGGGGGGGCIAIVTTGPDFGGLVLSAKGGQGDGASRHGAGGTVYLKKSGDTHGALLVNWEDRIPTTASTTTIFNNSTYQFDSIITTNGAVLTVGSNSTLNLTGCTLRSDSTTNSITSRLIVGTPTSTITWPAAWTNNGTISWTGANLITLPGSITVASGGILTHELGEANAVALDVQGDMTVDSSGAVFVNTRGYDGTYPGSGSDGRFGGAHGGEGGRGSGTTAGEAEPYGSVTNPVTAGSKGNYGSARGGGRVLLKVGGMLTLNGNIDAGGGNGGAGSAAGSINVRAATLAGAGGGTMTAKGGYGNNNGGGGGGGRIAVVLTNSADFSTVTFLAQGGDGSGGNDGYRNGGAGTIYLKGTNSAYGLLRLSNTPNINTVRSGYCRVNSLVTDAVVGDVELLDTARFAVDSPYSLDVYGNWSNAVAGLTVAGDGNVDFKGATAGTLYGSTVFPGFVCTNAGKMLLFQAGKTNTATTALNLAGASMNPVSLLPATAGEQWYIKAMDTMSPAYSISYVVVSNSTAVTNANGQELTAMSSTLADVGVDNTLNSNTNWNFPSPLPKTWDGSTDTDWGTDANWTPDGVPLSSDVSITIPAAPANQPTLDIARTYSCPLTIELGAVLTLGGRDLTMDAVLTNAGTIVATGSETLSCSKDVDFTGGTFTPASSTLKLNAAAAGSQTFKPAGNTFYRIEVPNAATVNFSGGGLTAQQFSCGAAGATLNFQNGSTYTITDLDLLGSSGNEVVLRSLSSGNRWNLNVTRAQAVRYVDAQDSDASGGLTIYACDSIGELQNNLNWNFGNAKVWLGGTTAWATDSNWSPLGAPGSADFVLIAAPYGSGANHPVLSAGAAQIAGLTVGGYVQTSELTLNQTLTVSGNAAVHSGGGKIKFATDTAGALTVNTNLTVFGTIECQRSSTVGYGAGRVITVGRDLTVVSNGLISAYAMGFTSGGPGIGYRASAHGGECYAADPNSKGATYGSITQPTSLGCQGYLNNPGGGAIRLDVGGLTTIEAGALINADANYQGQSGAGGSVWLTTGTLTGGGTISAKGGDTPGGSDGAGGGGRIAVVVTNGLYTGSLTVQAYGASNGGGVGDAAAGTVYLKGTNQAYGTLVVDNGDRGPTTGSRTRIRSSVTDKTVGDVILRNEGRMAVSPGETLTVNGSWSNVVAAAAIAGGTVDLAGTDPDPVTVWGGNTWSNLTIATLGKTVNFEAGKTQTVYGIPAFSNVTLQSTDSPNQWILTKPGIPVTELQPVGAVRVQDSDASGGMTFLPAGRSLDLGNNINWRLPDGGTMLMFW